MAYQPIKVIASAASADGHTNRVTDFDDTPLSNKMCYRDGLPYMTAVPNGQNTRGPRRVDLNGLFYLFSSNLFELQQGNFPTFNSAIVGTGKPLPDGYPLGAVLWYPTGGYFVRSLVPNNTNPNLNDTTAWAQVGVASKNIGEVFYSQSALAADNPGALPLFTGETISNADQLYPAFYNWVRTHSDLHISAADYETAISTYGECPKYVVDTVNKSVTLPLLKNFVKMANTTDGITEGEAGLPNITGKIGQEGGTNPDIVGGCVTIDNTDTTITQSLTTAVSGYPNKKIDASLSSSIYGNSNTVTPPHTTLYPWVFAFNVAVSASVAQAAEFQDALSGKVDLAPGVTQADVDYVIETYTSGTSWYRIYKSGWCEQGGRINNTNTYVTLLQTMADTDYTITMCSENGNYQTTCVENNTITTTGFRIVSGGWSGNYTWWQVAGMKASS